MNKNLFIDAIGCLDQKFIEEHISKRKKLRIEKMVKKKSRILKRIIVAACFTLFGLFSIVFSNLFHYENANEFVASSTKDELWWPLIASFLCVVVIGCTAWIVGKRIITKKYNTYNVL